MQRVLLVAVSLVCGACVSSNKVSCGDLTCPPGYTCDLAGQRCISPDQIAACNGVAEGGACDVAGAPGACRNGACEALVCGDGIVSGLEQCDGANLGSATCKDFRFYDEPGLACSAACTFDTTGCTGYCGDGMINGAELCDGKPPAIGACIDYGYDAGPIGCSATCGAGFDTCARIGWQILPLGNIQALAIAGSASNDVWVVGEKGMAAHFNGAAWATETVSLPEDYFAVSAHAGEAWAVGLDPSAVRPDALVHRDASGWHLVADAPKATYYDIWVLAPDAIYIATSDQEVQWWNGATWQQLGTLGTGARVIRGTSANDIWVSRSDGTLAHWDGNAWASTTLAGSIYHIAAIAPDDVWVTGQGTSMSGGLIANWNGSGWTTWLNPNGSYNDVAGSAPHDVWVGETGGGGLHFDGTSWSAVPISIDSAATPFVAFGPSSVVAVEYNGYAYHYSGQANAGYAAQQSSVNIGGVRAVSTTDVFAALARTIWYFNGRTWASQLTTTYLPFNAIAGTSVSDMWAMTPDGHVYQGVNGTWTEQTAPSMTPPDQLWARSGEVWVFTGGVAHHGPPPWTDYALENGGVTSVSGNATNDVWAVQTGLAVGTQVPPTYLQHWNGSAWSEVSVPAVLLYAVGARDANTVFVSTRLGQVLHWDGATWTTYDVPTFHALKWIEVFAADDVFAASDLDIVHFDGTRWSHVRPDIPLTKFPNAIVAVDAEGPGHFLYAHQRLSVVDLIRTRPWVCRARETNCNDGIDDDCDGLVDGLDSDCP